MARLGNNTTTGDSTSQRQTSPDQLPGNPSVIDQYGTGTGAGVRHLAHIVHISILGIATLFTLLGKKQYKLRL